MILDNQQVSPLTDVELSWVAGIAEGEGYVGIARKSKSDFQYIPRLAITNTDESMLDEVGRILESKNIAYYRIRRDIDKRYEKLIRGKPAKRNRSVSDIVFTGISRVRKVLEALIPYMRGEKKERAKIVLEFCINRSKQYNGNKPLPYTDYDHQLYIMFRKLVENPRDYTLDPKRG